MADDRTPPSPLSFPTKEAIQKDVLETLLVMSNQVRFAIAGPGTDGKLWALLSSRPLDYPHELANPDNSPDDLGLTWPDVAETALAQTLMELYDYGVLGLEDASAEELDNNEGGAAWVSRLLHDLRHSAFLAEWDEATGGRSMPSVERCLLLAETANARVLLEGGKEGFFLNDREAGYLTFRQLSLLSGMTESSLRTVASRASGGLVTERLGNNSYIEVSHAKQWLKARNRYTPVRRVSNAGAVPMTERRFASTDEFQLAIDQRVSYLAEEIGLEVLQQRLKGSPFGEPKKGPASYFIEVGAKQMANRKLMEALGKALDLPARMFALRAAETLHSEVLRHVEKEIQGATR